MKLRGQRAAFYSHDSMGLGHLRRTLLICQELRKLFRPFDVDCHRFGDGSRVSYSTGGGLRQASQRSQGRQRSVRIEVLVSALPASARASRRDRFPDRGSLQARLFFVDNVPLGLKGELRRTLQYIRDELPATRVILNLRDVVDSASHVRPLWRQLGVFEILEEFYDRIFIYGQASVFDLVTEYAFPRSLREKSRFCGYIPREADKQSSREVRRGLGLKKDEKLILVTVGGGSDGALIIENYLRSLPLVSKRHSVISVVLLGPEMDERNARRFESERSTSPVRLIDFCDDPLAYMSAADLVVSMAGYNTVSEILALRKLAIVIPRVHPRKEQWIRSQRLEQLGLLRMIHPHALTPDRLAAEITSLLEGNTPRAETTLDFGGMRRLVNEVQLLDQEKVFEPQQRFAKEAVL